MRSGGDGVSSTDWRRRAGILVVANGVLVVLLATAPRFGRTDVADANPAPTPFPAVPTPTPSPTVVPSPTPEACPDEPFVAVYKADEDRVVLQGAAHPDDVEPFLQQLDAVVGADRVEGDFLTDLCVPRQQYGVFRIEQGISFEHDSAIIRPEFEKVLDLAAVFVREFPLDMVVEGHTDSDGDDAYNQALSEDRAAAAVDYLVASGVSADRLDSAGFGESRPIDTNDTDGGKSKNRRIEFRLVPLDEAGEPVEDAGGR